jgi:peptide/nickel transport system permease protein
MKIGKTNKTLVLSLVIIAALHLIAIVPGFFAPYDFAAQNRDLLYSPPSTLHFADKAGHWHWRPSACTKQAVETDSVDLKEMEICTPIRFFISGSNYRVLGLFESNWHLFGVAPLNKLLLLGTDSFGRDVFSRFVYGSQISLLAGVLSTILTLVVGTTLGAIAGYYGGWIDALLMRIAELFLALPWLYLLFAIRAFLPLHLSPGKAFLLLIGVIGFVGWARPARLVRGIVLSAKERGYCRAARLFGASDLYLMRRHLLPETYSVILTQSALLIPQYILAEVTLSFLGLGVGEPVASWGNMLATLQQYDVLVSYWWMWAPGIAVIPVFLSYQLLASALQERARCSACQ